MAVRTTVVGSWWKLPELEEQLARHHKGELSADESDRVLNACAERAIKEQRELGLDEWTGGEYFLFNFVLHMHQALKGLRIDKPEPPEVFDYDDRPEASIVGELSAPNGLGYVTAFKRESKLPGGVKKATVVAPWEVATAALSHIDDIWKQNENLTEIVNAEMRGLADAGCEHVQLDTPAFGVMVNEGKMSAKEVADLLRPCFDGVETKKGIHICNGNLGGRPVSRVLSCGPWVEILQGLEGVVDVAHIECSYFSEWLERDAFSELPPNMELAAGIVDEANYWVEPVSKIEARIHDWAAVVGPERLWVAPSCGFGRHNARDIPVLRSKIEHMVEAAQAF